MTIAIRPETEADYRDVWQLHRVVFDSEAEPNLVDALRECGAASVSLVAVDDTSVVGHILFSPVSIVTESGTVEAVSLAPMGVVPERQREGIGSLLVEAGLEECRQQGHSIAVVLGHPEYYPRFGFSADAARRLDCPFGSGDVWMAMELSPGALDGVEGRVEYAAPFSAFE